MPKKVEKRNNLPIILVAIVVFGLVVSLPVFAGISVLDKLVQVAGETWGNRLPVPPDEEVIPDEEDSFGAINPWCQKGAATTLLCGVTFGDAVSFEATTTIPYFYHPIRIDLDYSQATSSAVGTWTLVLGKEKYNGPDLLCSGNGLTAITMDGLIPWTGTIRMATSTCLTAAAATCGDGTYSFNNTTTYEIITEAFATSTAWTDPADADDDEGDFTRELFVLSDNDWIVITEDMTGNEFATTTGALNVGTSGGLTATGKAYLDCRLK